MSEFLIFLVQGRFNPDGIASFAQKAVGHGKKHINLYGLDGIDKDRLFYKQLLYVAKPKNIKGPNNLSPDEIK